MARSIRILVDHDKCVGSRICTSIAPAVFGLDENGQACVIDPDADALTSILAAVEGCPLSAITIEQTEGKDAVSAADREAEDRERRVDGKR